MTGAWLEGVSLERHYQRGPQLVKAIDGIDIAIDRGEFVAIVGASGSGKSTLLNVLAGLDTPTSGGVLVGGRPRASFSRREMAAYRAHQVGMIFQAFHLIPHSTARENVELAFYFSPTPRAERRSGAGALLDRLGLGDRHDHLPADLSGGECQRVAIARALAGDPEVLFADEPTGNLDEHNTGQIADLLRDLHARGRGVVMTTHDLDLARACANRVVRLEYGRVMSEETLR